MSGSCDSLFECRAFLAVTHPDSDVCFAGLQTLNPGWAVVLWLNTCGPGVQVMSLLPYLMQHKGACGPHLIIVPNAVMVNWKSELLRWLPSEPMPKPAQPVQDSPDALEV